MSSGPGATGEPPDDVRRLARRGSAGLAGSAVTALAQLALTVVVARGLDKPQAGIFFTATSLFLILSTFTRLGTPTGLVWALSGQRARGENDRLRPTIGIALPPVLITGLVLALGLVLAAHPIAQALLSENTAPELVDRMVLILRAMAIFVPVAAIYDAVCAASRGLGVMRSTIYVERLLRPVLQCLAVAALAWYSGALLVTLAWLVPYAFALVLAGQMLLTVVRRTAPPGNGPAPRREFWAFTGPRALANLAQTIQQRLDIVLVGALLGPREAAIYAAATRFLVLGQAAGLAISMAVEPSLGAALGVGDRRGAGTVYRLGTAWLVVVTWPIYLFAFVAPGLVLSVFGRGYGAGAGVVRVLAAAMLVATGCGMVDLVLMMAGRTWWNLGNVGLGVGLFVVADLILIPRQGIRGAAIGWAVAILVNNLLPLAQVGAALRLHPFGRATAVAAAWALLACGVLPAVLLLPLHGSLWQLVAVVLLALAVYGAGLFRLRRPLELIHLPIPGHRGRALARTA